MKKITRARAQQYREMDRKDCSILYFRSLDILEDNQPILLTYILLSRFIWGCRMENILLRRRRRRRFPC